MQKKEKAKNQVDNEPKAAQNEAQTEAENTTAQGTEEASTDEDTDKMAENCNENVKEWQDKYMRLSAEFDNYRKRTLKEKVELVENGGKEVLKAMLATADDFDRALQHITDESAKAGVELIYTKFLSALQAKGVKEMDLIGKPFDVDFAEAIAKFPATDPAQSGTVMDVAEKGYMIGERVLRFAKVVVFE